MHSYLTKQNKYEEILSSIQACNMSVTSVNVVCTNWSFFGKDICIPDAYSVVRSAIAIHMYIRLGVTYICVV